VRPVDKPIAWVGHDRILLDDVSVCGLRRKVVARKEDVPNTVGFLEAAFREADLTPDPSPERRGEKPRVRWWLVYKSDGYFYLWIVWKKEG